MICIESSVKDLYGLVIFIPITAQSQFPNHRSVTLIGHSWHPGCSYFHCRGRVEITCSSMSDKVLLVLLRAAKRAIGRTVVVCGSAVAGSRICECPGSCYRRAVFIGDELAAHASPCSSAAHREGAILEPVRRRPLPSTLESIDKHQYCGYATRSKSFLFRPCLSAQWTALNSRWTHRYLGGATYCLHV